MKTSITKQGLEKAEFSNGWEVRQRKDGGLTIYIADGGASVDSIQRVDSKKPRSRSKYHDYFMVHLLRG